MNLADVILLLERVNQFLAGKRGNTAQFRKGRADQLMREIEGALQSCRTLMLDLHEAKQALKEANSATPPSPAIR